MLLLPSLAFGAENCVEQLKGTCKDVCGQNEAAEQGSFLDCAANQQCCITKGTVKASAVSPQVIVLDGYAFSPADMKIRAGTEVVWRNRDGVDHTVTAEDKSFDSGPLGPNAEFKRKFTKPGTYPYFCDMHPSMTGRITVE